MLSAISCSPHSKHLPGLDPQQPHSTLRRHGRSFHRAQRTSKYVLGTRVTACPTAGFSPGMDGSATLLASEPAETQPLLSTAAGYCQGEASQGQGACLQQLFCPLCPERMQQTVLLFAFFFKSFLYISIFFLFEHQKNLSLVWLVVFLVLFIFVGGGI